MKLKGKVALVTGAASGIGASIVKEYLEEGAKVIIADINEDLAYEFAISTGYSEKYWLIKKVDVSNRENVKECIASGLEEFGKIDILVANAGVTIRKSFFEVADEDYDYVMNINAKGVFICSQEVAKVMSTEQCGSIILISSITASSVPQPNVLIYGASKGAILSMTKHMALALAEKNIRVNAISPGTILTNLNKNRLANISNNKSNIEKIVLDRIGVPNDIVKAAIFLATEDSSFVTGSELVIDGGESII